MFRTASEFDQLPAAGRLISVRQHRELADGWNYVAACMVPAISDYRYPADALNRADAAAGTIMIGCVPSRISRPAIVFMR
jgi:hypothetical protein